MLSITCTTTQGFVVIVFVLIATLASPAACNTSLDTSKRKSKSKSTLSNTSSSIPLELQEFFEPVTSRPSKSTTASISAADAATVVSTGVSDESKPFDWKVWKKFKARSEKKQEPSTANDGADADADATGDAIPQKQSPKKRWGDARKPSKTDSKAAVANKNASKENPKSGSKDNPVKTSNNNLEKDDMGGDDIVYGPLKRDRTKQKEGKKQDKANNNRDKKQKEQPEKKLSAYERKKAAIAQKKNDTAQARDQGRRPKQDDASKKSDPTEQDAVETDTEDENDEVVTNPKADSGELTQQTNQTRMEKEQESGLGVPPNRAAYLVMGASPPQGYPHQLRPGSPSRQPQPMPSNRALALATVVTVSSAFTKLWIILWITRRLAAEHEILTPVQHFVWECLNDRYARDEAVFSKALATPAGGLSKLKWNKYIKAMRNHKNRNTTMPKPQAPTKTVIVVDITPKSQLDIGYLKDVVTFLVGAHRQSMLGKEPEIILLVQSPGGEVTSFGLAAAQIARLEQTGIQVTACVDSIAASGGYMIASQSSQVIAAPFAMVGSIGVIREGLNYNKLLTDHGIKPMVLKAGEMKNPLSSLGPVTDDDIKAETERLEETHRAFIDWCLSRRPCLDPSVCNGTVLIGKEALSFGLVDRVLTSDEYIWEKICEGDHVLKLHKTFRDTDRTRIFARALDLLPHLRHQLTRLQGHVRFSQLAQGYAVLNMVQRALRQR